MTCVILLWAYYMVCVIPVAQPGGRGPDAPPPPAKKEEKEKKKKEKDRNTQIEEGSQNGGAICSAKMYVLAI